jgi:hypothetical protein
MKIHKTFKKGAKNASETLIGDVIEQLTRKDGQLPVCKRWAG